MKENKSLPKGLSLGTVNYVARILEQATEAANVAAQEFIDGAPKDDSGFVRDACGFSNIHAYNGRTAFIKALRYLQDTQRQSGGSYWVTIRCSHGEQSITVNEIAMNAAVEVLRNAFPENQFYVSSRLD